MSLSRDDEPTITILGYNVNVSGSNRCRGIFDFREFGASIVLEGVAIL